jgi:hypothetical protein
MPTSRAEEVDWSADGPALLEAVHNMGANCSDKRSKPNVGQGDPILVDPCIHTLDELIDDAGRHLQINPIYSNLDDSTLFTQKKRMNGTACSRAFPSVFDGNGNVRLTRRPVGKPPVAMAYGVKWLFLIDGRYILTGEKLAQTFPWFIANNRPSNRRGLSPLQVGYVTVPDDWTDDDYQLVEMLDGPRPEEGTPNIPHAQWSKAVSYLNTQTQVRTDFDQYVVVPPSKGGQARCVRMCDLPSFRENLLQPGLDSDKGTTNRNRKGTTRKPITTPSSENATTQEQFEPGPDDIHRASVRELIRNCADWEGNGGMMRALGKFVKARNALARAAFDDPNASEVTDLITGFKTASAAANAEIMKRAPDNRRGAKFAGDFLRREQIRGIDTDLPEDDGIARKTATYLQDSANNPAEQLATALTTRRPKRRRRSDTTSEEDN